MPYQGCFSTTGYYDSHSADSRLLVKMEKRAQTLDAAKDICSKSGTYGLLMLGCPNTQGAEVWCMNVGYNGTALPDKSCQGDQDRINPMSGYEDLGDGYCLNIAKKKVAVDEELAWINATVTSRGFSEHCHLLCNADVSCAGFVTKESACAIIPSTASSYASGIYFADKGLGARCWKKRQDEGDAAPNLTPFTLLQNKALLC